MQIALDWYLTGQPAINIVGSPFGTLTCYAVITILNMVFIVAEGQGPSGLSRRLL